MEKDKLKMELKNGTFSKDERCDSLALAYFLFLNKCNDFTSNEYIIIMS